MSTAALFTIAKVWKQPKCPPIDEWTKSRYDKYTCACILDRILFSHEKERNVAIHDTDGSGTGVPHLRAADGDCPGPVRNWAAGQERSLNEMCPQSSQNHSPTPVCRGTVFHKGGPWCQKGWGPLSEISQTEKDKYYDFSYMENLKRKAAN